MAALTLDEAFLELDRAEDSAALRDVLLKTTRSLSAVLHGTSSDFVERTKEYIFEHIGQDLSLEDIAEHFLLKPVAFQPHLQSASWRDADSIYQPLQDGICRPAAFQHQSENL